MNKWKTILILLPVSLLILGGGLFLAERMKDRPGEPLTRKEVVTKAQRTSGIVLSESATDIHYEYESLFVGWTYLRFDLPADDLEGFLRANRRLPELSEFITDVEKVSLMKTFGEELSWWQFDELETPVFGEKSGTYQSGDRYWQWHSSMLMSQDNGKTRRVYIVVSEEPVAE